LANVAGGGPVNLVLLGGMDAIKFVAPVLGFFFGTFIVTRVGYWLVAIVSTLRQHRTDAEGEAATSKVGRLPATLFLHSGPWLLAATLYWAYYMLSRPYSSGWLWFFGGVAAAPILWMPVFWSFRRPRSTSAAEATSEIRERPLFRFARWMNVKRNNILMGTLIAGSTMSIFMSLTYYDAIKRTPELIVVIIGGSMVIALVMSAIFWSITHPKPWRVPPKKP
jgi:hypothetical protein